LVERSLRILSEVSMEPGSPRWHDVDLGQASEFLRGFILAEPHIRIDILGMLKDGANQLEPGARVIDIGAGEAPYRELFGHLEYVTVDWSDSYHEGAKEADVIASAESIPLPDESFDAAVMTEVLEHLPDSTAALKEAARILRPGGQLFLTVPFVWPLHEMPHDYYRLTPSALRQHLDAAGFDVIDLAGRGDDYFTTLATLMRASQMMIGSAEDGLDPKRADVAQLLERLSRVVEVLEPLDSLRILPLGFNVRAKRR
jgi:SAM-dependent methyltransferase